MSKLPHWAIKPNHPKEVIATSRGWEVAHTGEVLTSCRGLDEKLKALFKETDALREEVKITEEKVEEPTETEEKVEEPQPEEPVKPVKRRGRPPKAKKTEDTE